MLLRIAPAFGVGVVALLFSVTVLTTNAVGHDQLSRNRLAGVAPAAHSVTLAATSNVTALQNLATASRATVLDQAVLDTAAKHAASVLQTLASLRNSLRSAETILASNSLDRVWGGGTAGNGQLEFEIAAEQRQLRSDLLTMASDTSAIKAAVAQWSAEQARIAVAAAAAQEAAAAAAAAEAAAAAAAAANNGRSPVASEGSKDSIARAIFARFGFSNFAFDTGQSRGHWGATDLDRQIIYLQLSLIPLNKVAWVAKHEFGHIVQAETYGGYSATVAHFGSVAAMEADADAFANSH